MNAEAPRAPASALLQPAVLVGGASRRFGRDKLREPWRGSEGGEWIVDQPIRALRSVFGARVWTVGDCDEAVARRAERHLPDAYPGAGPMGGVITALRTARADVLVLSGDLPWISAAEIALVHAAAADHQHGPVLASTPTPQPCIAVYRFLDLARLVRLMAEGRTSLRDAAGALSARYVQIPPDAARSANRPEDLPGAPAA